MQSKTSVVKNPSASSAFTVLRISVGVVYFWFGALKFFQSLSPAEQLAMQTIHKITFGLISDHINIITLALWECFVGLLLMTGKWIKPALVLLFLHMICTFTPFIFFPNQTFNVAPYGLSLTGQYIVKNIIIIAARLVLWKIETQKSVISDLTTIHSEHEEFVSPMGVKGHSPNQYSIKQNSVNN